MKVQELRIGNLVYDNNNEVITVDALDEGGVNPYHPTDDLHVGSVEYDEVKPIPLTEEWLLDFGFCKNKNNDYWLGWITGYLELIPSKGFFYPQLVSIPELSNENEQRVPFRRIEFVHDLQNVIFALTGEELKLKP